MSSLLTCQVPGFVSGRPLVGLCRRLQNMTYWALPPVQTPSFPNQTSPLEVFQLESVGLQLPFNNTLSVGLHRQRGVCCVCVCDDFNPTSDGFCRPAYCPACHSLSHTHTHTPQPHTPTVKMTGST